jgi:hypothetical protein
VSRKSRNYLKRPNTLKSKDLKRIWHRKMGCYYTIVAILEQASVDDRMRLLELFPVKNLRQTFQAKGAKKEEICFAAASDAQPAQINRVAEFVDNHFSCCKQHAYVFTGDGNVPLPAGVIDGEKVLEGALHNDSVHALYMSRVKYDIVLRDPLEETTLDFLWPIKIESRPPYLIVRFIVLEKNASSYFDRPTYVAGKSLNEKLALNGIGAGLKPADINKGIKTLWEKGVIDSTRGLFKKPHSTAQEIMDEELGIKANNPDLYQIMQESPLYTTLFDVTDENNSVREFSTDPSRGLVGFSSYSEQGDADGIIGQIISSN